MSTAAAPTSLNNVSTVEQSMVQTAPVERPPWSEIAEWRSRDPRAKPAPPPADLRDPFQTPEPQAEENPEEQISAKKTKIVTPDAAGLVLTGTIIGPDRRIAQINGKTYVVGQTVEAASETSSSAAAFQLVEVDARRAVLEINGERFELMIPEPGSSEKIQLSGANP